MEFGRPADWFPALQSLRIGLLAAMWACATVVLARSRPVPPIIWLVLAFLPLMVLHLFTSYNRYMVYLGLEDFAVLVLGGTLPLSVLPGSRRAIRLLLTFWVWIHVTVAIYGIFHHGRGFGPFLGDENDLALGLNIALGIAIFLWMDTRSLMHRVFLLSAMGLLLAGIVSTISRGGFVGMASLGVYLLAAGPHRRVIAACIVVAVIGLLLLSPPTYWNEVRSIRDATNPKDTGSERLYSWGIAWKMFVEDPIIGAGTKNYSARAWVHQDIDWRNRDASGVKRRHLWGREAHSMYFTLLPEHGLVGVALFSGILGIVVRSVLRLRRRTRERPDDPQARSDSLVASGLAAGLFALLATGTFISVFYYPFFWALVGLLAAHVAISDRDGAPPETVQPRPRALPALRARRA
jgi:hypothetical protein